MVYNNRDCKICSTTLDGAMQTIIIASVKQKYTREKWWLKKKKKKREM